MSGELEARIVELESRVAFQDDLLSNLNRTVAELGDEVVALRKLTAELRDALEAVRLALAHDVAARVGAMHVTFDQLQEDQAPDQRQEGDDHRQHHPAIAPAELPHVGALDQEVHLSPRPPPLPKRPPEPHPGAGVEPT